MRGGQIGGVHARKVEVHRPEVRKGEVGRVEARRSEVPQRTFSRCSRLLVRAVLHSQAPVGLRILRAENNDCSI